MTTLIYYYNGKYFYRDIYHYCSLHLHPREAAVGRSSGDTAAGAGSTGTQVAGGEVTLHRESATLRGHHGADPLAGPPGRHPAVLLLHPLPLQGSGHARAPDLRRQLEVPDLHRPGDPGRVLRPVRPDRCVQPADQGRRQQGAGAAAEEADWPEGLDDGRAGLPRRSVCGLYILEPLPVRQRAGLPQTTGQLHPSVAQPRHAHHGPSLHHHRDADHPPSVSQEALGSGCSLLLRRRIHPLDLLGAPGDGGLGLPGAGTHRSAGPSRLLQRHDGGDLYLLRSRRNPQQLRLGPVTHRKGQR